MPRPRQLKSERRPGQVLNQIQRLVYEHWDSYEDGDCLQMQQRVQSLVRAPALVPIIERRLYAAIRTVQSRRTYLLQHTGNAASEAYTPAQRRTVTTAEMKQYLGDLPEYLRPPHPAMFELVGERLRKRHVNAMNEAASCCRRYNALRLRLRRVATTLALQAREIDEIQRTYALANGHDADVAFHDME